MFQCLETGIVELDRMLKTRSIDAGESKSAGQEEDNSLQLFHMGKSNVR